MKTKGKESKNSNIGKIITFGSLNLLLTLKLEEDNNKVKDFSNLNDLQDLSFITDNKKLWEKIELSSKSELLNSLLQMNKIKKNKSVIAYLVYNKLEFNDNQNKFKDLIDTVLLDNGLVIYSYEICQCSININLKLIYKDKSKTFVIYGEKMKDEEEEKKDKNDNNKNEEEKNDNDGSENKKNNEENNGNAKEQENGEEEDKNDIGNFEMMNLKEIRFNDFKYLYIHFNDYISGGEFSNEFKLNQIYNFLVKIKKKYNIKIIFNFGDFSGEDQKYLAKFIKISDVHVFRNKNLLMHIMNNKIEKELQKREKEKEKIQKFLRNQKMQQKTLKESKNSSLVNLKQSNLYQSSDGFKRTLHKSRSLKEIPLASSFNSTHGAFSRGPLDKNNIFYYFRELIFSSSLKEKHPNYNDKLGIYLDDYKKIFLIDYKKNNFMPDITEYDLNVYPKPNVYNLKKIDKTKEILKKYNSKYTAILYGCILSTIVDDLNENSNNYFMFYMNSHISLGKILALQKNEISEPNDKSFYIINLKKNDYEKISKEENNKKQEEGFNNNYYHRKHKNNDNNYYPLMDKFLTSYMQSLVNIDNLKNKNLINDKKRILYDPEYKDLYKNGTIESDDLNHRQFAKFIINNPSNNIKDMQKDYKKEFLNKKPEMNFYIPGINGIPEYIVYLDKDERKKRFGKKLPPIKRKESEEEVKMIKQIKDQITEKEEEKPRAAENQPQDEPKQDTSKYKEEQFQPTQLEVDNLDK